MPRRKAAAATNSPDFQQSRVLRKRSRDDDGAVEAESTPRKRRRGSVSREALSSEQASVPVRNETAEDSQGADRHDNGGTVESAHDQELELTRATPRRRGRPLKAPSQAGTPNVRAQASSELATPVRATGSTTQTPTRQAADRSARRKSARALMEHAVGNDASDDEQGHDEDLVREIYEDGESDVEDVESLADDQGLNGDAVAQDTALVDKATTPSKTPRRGQRKRAKSPDTPPRDLPPHELYFANNKPGRPKTSDNTLGSLALLTHEEYFNLLRNHQDPHGGDVEYLEALHAESFPQWLFELAQGFSLCLYGFGSKRALLQKFAKYLHSRARGRRARKTVIVNGYAHATSMREILSCVGEAIDPKQRIPASAPSAMVQSIAARLASADLTLTVIINSIDAAPLRKPVSQAALAQLAALPQVNVACSADTPDFPLLWDVGVRSAFNFVFHDCTTFAPLTVELDVVDEVHELLGRKARRVNGRQGVAFVLRSLPENAKNLFRLLVSEVLVAMEEEGNVSDDVAGVEYRMMYNKAVEEFICTSEMAFRTLLKEFHDHQMITSRKDALGTELLSVPFQREELEAILEDLMA